MKESSIVNKLINEWELAVCDTSTGHLRKLYTLYIHVHKLLF